MHSDPEATRLGLARKASGDEFTLHPAISKACRHLGATLVRALQQLKSFRRTILLKSRGAVPH